MSKISYPNKNTGDTFTGDEATQIKSVVNLNDDEAVIRQSEVDLNTNKVGITTTQASDIVTNNAKVGITPTQATAITDNTDTIGDIETILLAI